MITDLFSHKIHSSGTDWPDRLVELASVFAEFDGLPFNRQSIEDRLLAISPRSAYAPRDPSKFRDEISAYPAYLGLYSLHRSGLGWIMRLSRTARHFLLREEPNVGGFMRLQLALFQYPNGMGAIYQPNSNRISKIQANARTRTLGLISQGVHLSPLRLICRALAADATINDIDILQARAAYSEIYALANSSSVNRLASPPPKSVVSTMLNTREGNVRPPGSYERRFHILQHTELFTMGNGAITVRKPIDKTDEADLRTKISTLLSIDCQFNGFDNASTESHLSQVISSGEWASYFDALDTLPAGIVQVLGADLIEAVPDVQMSRPPKQESPQAYVLAQREDRLPLPPPVNVARDYADPEVTRIRRQRRNLAHKTMLDRLDQLIRDIGATPMQSPHIDMYAEVPQDGAFLFEVKSGGQNVFEQIRKGVSQLYEYRYRYRGSINSDVALCLLLPNEPQSPPWLVDYLCEDRQISVCWFDEDGSLEYPTMCSDKMGMLSGKA